MNTLAFSPYRVQVRPDDSTQQLKEVAESVHNWQRVRAVSYVVAPQLLRRASASYSAVMRQHEPELQAIGGGLERARAEIVQMLQESGFKPTLADAIMRYVDLKVSTDVAVTEIVSEQARQLYESRDPTEALSAAELAKALGVSDETVRNREQAGELFSVMRPGRKRGREYPAFQAWEGIAGEPLKQILAALGGPSGPAAYAFFTSPADTLAGLSPIEALLGFEGARAGEGAREFLTHSSPAERLDVVIRAARAYAAALAA